MESIWDIIRHSAEGLKTNIQESGAGWRYVLGGVSSQVDEAPAIIQREFEETLIGLGYGLSHVQAKAGEVSAESPYSGVCRMENGMLVPCGMIESGNRVYDLGDPGTPATVVATIQKNIGESLAGWRMAFTYVGVKARQNIVVATIEEKIGESVAGLGYGSSLVVGKIGESFGNIGSSFKSVKWGFYILIPIIIFIAIMVAIGYSGVGAPVARVAEREYVKRR